MDFSFRVALRYTLSRRKINIINVISFVSALGIMVGVAAIICVMSIFNGFREIAMEQIIGFDPHIRLSSSDRRIIDEQTEIISLIDNIPFIKTGIPIVYGRTIIFRGSNMQAISLYSLPDNSSQAIPGVKDAILFGEYDIIHKSGLASIVLGAGVGDRLRAFPGDTVFLMSPEMIESSFRMYRRQGAVPAIVRGIYQTNQVYDTYGFSGEGIRSGLFKKVEPNDFAIDIRLENISELDFVFNELSKILPQYIKIETWRDLNSELYRIMDFERLAAFVILSLIILIAVFNILASLNMTVVEKRSNIAALKSMGATDRKILQIFMYSGLIIGFSGTIAGLILGLGLCYGQINYGWFELDSSKYFVSQIPLQIDYIGVAAICAVSMFLSFLATLYPSKRAADTAISQTMREE